MPFRFRAASLIATAACTLLFVSACSAGDVAPGTTAAESNDTGTEADARETLDLAPVADGVLHTCLTGDYRPFSYAAGGADEFKGIDIEMVEAFAADLSEQTGRDITVEYVKTSWKELMPTFLSSCDIAVGGISVTDERKEQVAFSIPVIHGGKAAITTCGDEEDFDTIAEINQPTTVVITPVGGTNEEFANEHFSDAEIIRFDDNNSIFEEIVSGNANVMVTDAPEVVWAAHEHPELCQVNADEPFNTQELAYMLPKDDEEFRDAVNTWLERAFEDGTWDEATRDWFGEDSVFSSENRPAS